MRVKCPYPGAGTSPGWLPASSASTTSCRQQLHSRHQPSSSCRQGQANPFKHQGKLPAGQEAAKGTIELLRCSWLVGAMQLTDSHFVAHSNLNDFFSPHSPPLNKPFAGMNFVVLSVLITWAKGWEQKAEVQRFTVQLKVLTSTHANHSKRQQQAKAISPG